MFITGSAVKSLGKSIHDLGFYQSTIRRSQQHCRKQLFAGILQNFSGAASLTVRWNGKFSPDLTDKKRVDRLATPVSHQAETQLLCSQKLTPGQV